MKIKAMGGSAARTFVLVLAPGDEAVSAISGFAREHEIGGAEIVGIGAFARATLAYWDPQTKEYLPIAIDEQVEAVSFTGNIARTDQDDFKLHVHVVVGMRDGSTRAGHLLEAHVNPTLELVVRELPGELRRAIDPATGLALLQP